MWLQGLSFSVASSASASAANRFMSKRKFADASGDIGINGP